MTKKLYRVRNWKYYNKSLVQRGSLTIWFSEESLDKWFYDGKRKRGGIKLYSDIAILTALVLKEVYKLTYRSCQGLIASLLVLLKLKKIKPPNYTTICRRAKNLKVKISSEVKSSEKVCVLVDSTGIKVQGETQWYLQKHKKLSRQKWKKLHISMDHGTHQILSAITTDSYVHDASHFGNLIKEIDKQIKIDTIIGDGCYSLHTSHIHAQQRGAKLIAPPHINSRKKSENTDYRHSPETPLRDEAIEYVRQFDTFEEGLKAWKQDSNYHYHRRSLIETAMFRLKSVFTGSIKAKLDCTQAVLLKIRCLILNKMTELGMPSSYVFN